SQDLTLIFTVPQITRISGGEPFLIHSTREAAWHFPPHGSHRIHLEASPEALNSKGADVKFPPMPSETELQRNICAARQRSWHDPTDALWFRNQFNDQGPMDYKRQGKELTDFGNFNFGVMGAAMGWPTVFLLNEAGINQMQPGKP